MAYTLDDLIRAFGAVESSQNYGAIGPVTRSGGRAYGRYQVMDFNVPSWTEQYAGRRMTPQEYLANPAAQDAVFRGRMGEYYNSGSGTPEDRVRNAASLWFTGQPYSAATAGRDDQYITNQEYGNRILAALGAAPTSSTVQGGQRMVDQMQTQRPQGLLERMGLQRRDEAAGGETAMPFYQRPQFREFATNLGLAMGGLSTRPNEMALRELGRRQDQRSADALANRTVQWLSQQPGGETFVRMIEAGANPAQAIAAWQQAQAQEAERQRALQRGEFREVDGRLVRVMGDGTVIPVDIPGQHGQYTSRQFAELNTLRDDLRTDLGMFRDVRDGYNRILTFFDNPSGVSDYALAVSFAKILDPGTAAREGEVAAVQGADALLPGLTQRLRNALNGEGGLTEEMRQQIASLASGIYAEQAAEAQNTIDHYSRIAQNAGLSVEDLIPFSVPEPREIPFPSDLTAGTVSPPEPAGLPPGVPPMTQSAIAAQLTPQQWAAMEPADRTLFP